VKKNIEWVVKKNLWLKNWCELNICEECRILFRLYKQEFFKQLFLITPP